MRETEWSATALIPSSYSRSDSVCNAIGISHLSKDLGSRALLEQATELFWYPSEVDVSIRPGWFYHREEDDKVKSLSTLVDIYFKSVGYNSVLLLNIPPDTRGLIHENDTKRLQELAQYISHTFATDYGKTSHEKITGKEGDSFEINITATTPVNTLLLQEDIQNGQRIEAFTVEASINGVWEKISEGTTIGYKRLVRFDDVIADKLRVTINRTRADFSILRTGIFYANPIIEKSEEAQNSVFTPQECLIGDKEAVEAIDKKIETAIYSDGLSPILIDLGKIRSIKGFCYTPVQEGNTDGTIFHYNLYQSNDGKEWKGIILNGAFSNIKNNPIPQFVTFGKVLETRYLKLEPIEEINGNQKTSIAEFSVVIP